MPREKGRLMGIGMKEQSPVLCDLMFDRSPYNSICSIYWTYLYGTTEISVGYFFIYWVKLFDMHYTMKVTHLKAWQLFYSVTLYFNKALIYFVIALTNIEHIA